MTKYITSRLKMHGATAMHLVSGVTASMLRVAKKPPPDLSREAKKRLKWFGYYEGHGRNASLTCRYFGISRPTFYRWLRRYNPRDLGSLEDRQSVPKRRRRPSWGVESSV